MRHHDRHDREQEDLVRSEDRDEDRCRAEEVLRHDDDRSDQTHDVAATHREETGRQACEVVRGAVDVFDNARVEEGKDEASGDEEYARAASGAVIVFEQFLQVDDRVP